MALPNRVANADWPVLQGSKPSLKTFSGRPFG